MPPIDNRARHCTYKLREQPALDETDVGILHDHIAVLRTELAKLTRQRLAVRMRTETSALALQAEIGSLNEALAEAYVHLAGAPPGSHATECAINQAPAYRPGPCDCGARVRAGSAGGSSIQPPAPS